MSLSGNCMASLGAAEAAAVAADAGAAEAAAVTADAAALPDVKVQL